MDIHHSQSIDIDFENQNNNNIGKKYSFILKNNYFIGKYEVKDKKKCIINCIDDDIYKCEIDNICYESCPESDKSDIFNLSDKQDISDIHHESDKSNISNIHNESDISDISDIPNQSEKIDISNIPNESYGSDIPNESYLSDISNITNESNKQDLSDIPNESYVSDITNITNESNISDLSISNITNESNILDISNISDIHNEINKSYISDKSIKKEITNNYINKNECPENTPYLNQNNECIKKCNAKDFFNKICIINNNNPKTQDDMINTIKNQLSNGTLNSLLSNVINGEKNDLLIVSNNITYQITTTDNQNNKNYTNISTIKLGDCEEILKEKYKIDKNKTLLILKIDYYMEGLYIPVINYEIYNPNTNEKLDLNYCKETYIDLDIPVSIYENNLFKYDPNSEYYTDDCYSYTTENGTDIILNDRKEEFINNNMSLCENNCYYNGYNEQSKKSLCECEVKSEQSLINEIINNDNILSNNFTFDNSTSNMKTMKCTSTLFSKDGLLNNIASYILIIITLIYIILIIVYYKFGDFLINNDIQKILSDKRKTKRKSNIFNMNKNENKKKRKSKMNINYKIGNPLKNKRNSTKKKSSKIIDRNYKIKSLSKIELNNTNILINIGKVKSNNFQIHKNINKNKRKTIKTNYYSFIKNNKFYDSEMNSFPYQIALQFDRRTYFKYYVSLIKTKHPLLFSFIPKKDYNIFIIKINLFLLSYVIYFGINTFFFNYSTIHKIYEDQGNYNLKYHINQIIYSFLISHFICCIIKYLVISERYLLQIKYESSYEKPSSMADKVKRCLLIKYLFFFVFSMVFLLFFWYYLSSFCAVFQNSQLFLFINTIISCIIALLYPFFINIFPGIFRIPSLNKNTNKECLYKLSQIIQYL